MNENYLDAAIVFHPRLNPAIWADGDMKPEVREHLLDMAKEFQDFLGIDELNILDITVSGSNAAYTYTSHSDIDLHLVVKIPASQNQLYTELFDAKKNLYNRMHKQQIKGFDVEFYVQDVDNPVQSIGIYSVLNGNWISVPKRIRATIDDVSVLSKVDSFTVRIHECLVSDDLAMVQQTWDDLKAMRKAGLEEAGEFSPENLAFKILRTRGLQEKLFNRIIELKDKQLSLESLSEQQLNELFDSKVGYDVVRDTSTVFVTQAEIGGRTIQFTAVDEGYGWDVEFSEKVGGKHNYGMTGSRSEMQVMAMVKQSMEEFIDRYQPEQINFTAAKDNKAKGDEPEVKSESRAKVYQRMLSRYSSMYTISTREDANGVQFEMKRKG